MKLEEQRANIPLEQTRGDSDEEELLGADPLTLGGRSSALTGWARETETERKRESHTDTQ